MMTEPPACLASLPVSKRNGLLLMEISRVVIGVVLEVHEVHGVHEVHWVHGSRFWGSRTVNPVNLGHLVNRANPLFSDIETLDEIRVPLGVLALEVVEEPAAAADEH